MKSVYLYIEGGGDNQSQQSRLKEGYRRLLEKSGFKGSMPRIVPCGGRDQTFSAFKNGLSHRSQADIAILLVDSEDVVALNDVSLNAPIWQHLKSRDNWEKPDQALDSQVALMVTSMETWIMADHDSLLAFFGKKLNPKALLPTHNLETRGRKEVFAALVKATEPCGQDHTYRKGDKSFQILATLNPETLSQQLPHFRRFIEVLRHHLG